MPMARIASALRRLDSTSRLRAADCAAASRIGARESTSLKAVRTTSTIAPVSAVMPIQTWNAKHTAR